MTLPFELEPGVIFAIVAGASFLIITGMGLIGALGVYGLDRLVRGAESDTPGEYPSAEASTASRAEAVVVTPSELSQFIASSGEVEVPPSLELGHTKLGMWAFLASEILFFTSLIAAYLYFRFNGQIPADFQQELNIPLTAVNTFLLLTSSFTVVLAFESIQEGRFQRFRWFLVGTFVLGAVFVSVQGIEWSALLQHGLTPASEVFGTIFFVLTGFHGLHVTIGLLWLVLVIIRAYQGGYNELNSLGIEIFGLYWHFVDIVWIVLFTIIYLI